MIRFLALPFLRMRQVRLFCCALAGSLVTVAAAAQPTPAVRVTGTTPDDFTILAATQERLGENHLKLSGGVELAQKDTTLFADEIEIFSDQDRAIASGNVVFTQGANRIAADRADFNTRTKLGTFFSASGIATVQPPRRVPGPGAFAPPPSTQDTDVYFFGDVVEKIGARRYKITNGGFSTCVQPTPRWDLHADTVVLNIDHYTVLTNAVLNVKGVPLFYVPVLYYPTKKENRATGFLLPTYGTSSLRGQALHNAFFWAINRSQDATVMHDWYSRAGQGMGSEYRYNYGGGSDGIVAAHVLDQKATTSSAGSLPEERAYEVRGLANQMLPGRLQLRARADYFSSVSVNQTFNTNIYDASRSSRFYGANVAGAWRTLSLNGTYDRNEFFLNETSSQVLGSSPRIALARNERPLFRNSPLYVSAATEFVHFDRETRDHDVVLSDSNVTRIDAFPLVRFPFKRWQWFTVNSSLGWRDTFYTRSVGLDRNGNHTIVDDNVNRQYFTLQAQAVGPVFNRIFNTPDNGYAERFKHTVEPFLNVQRTSAIQEFGRIIQTDSVDTVVGNTTNYTYGLNNSVYAKRRTVQGRPSLAQEILAVEIVQTYYTSPLASAFDTRYTTSYTGAQPSNFSPLMLGARVTPAQSLNASVRVEIDSHYKEVRTLSTSTNYNWLSRLQTQVLWTKTFFIEGLNGFNNPQYLSHYLNVSTNARTLDNRYGTMYSFNYDILHGGFLQQRISAFYNAQCCGLAFEYQTYNYAGAGSLFPPDRRFFLSFTLAGLGNFSPFNGAMSGMPR